MRSWLSAIGSDCLFMVSSIGKYYEEDSDKRLEVGRLQLHLTLERRHLVTLPSKECLDVLNRITLMLS